MYLLDNLLNALDIEVRPSEKLPLQLGIRIHNEDSKLNSSFHEFWPEFWAASVRQNVALAFDGLGIFLGHIAWAPRAVEKTAAQDGVRENVSLKNPVAISDVVDFSVSPGNFSRVVRFLRRNVFAAGGHLSYARQQNTGKTSKRKIVKLKVMQPLPMKHDIGAPFFLTREGRDVKHAIMLFLDEALQIGKAITLLGQDPSYSGLPLADIVNRARNPLTLEQAKLFFDANKDTVGFVSWAWVENCEADWMLNAGTRTIDQWNYGESLCICDVVCAPGYESHINDFMRNELYPNEDLLISAAANLGHFSHRGIDRAVFDIRDFIRMESMDAAA